MDTSHARKRYDVAKARALADPSQLDDIVRRLSHIEKTAASDGSLNSETIDAVLGGVEVPEVSISEAMNIYQSEIMRSVLRGKSRAQLKLWTATKDRSLKYFVDVMGDLAMNFSNNLYLDRSRVSPRRGNQSAPGRYLP